jgi:hypothetical protein
MGRVVKRLLGPEGSLNFNYTGWRAEPIIRRNPLLSAYRQFDDFDRPSRTNCSKSRNIAFSRVVASIPST